MGTLKINGETFECESFGTPTIVEGYYQTTFTGPAKDCCKYLKSLLKSGKIKKFKANAFYGQYSGTIQVLERTNLRSYIVRFHTFKFIKHKT